MPKNDIQSISSSESSSPVIEPSFSSMKCSLDENGKITTLAVDKINLITDGNVSSNKTLSNSSVLNLKKELEEIFKDNKNLFPSKKKFEIIKCNNNDLFLQTKYKKIKILNSWKNIILGYFFHIPTTKTYEKKFEKKEIASQTTQKISNIYDNYLANAISHKTAIHNIEQLQAKPNANKTIVKLLLTALTIGLLVGIIGLGGILPHFGITYLAKLGIPGISTPIAISSISIGVITFSLYAALKITAKKSEKAKDYLNAIHLLKSNLFLESNLNDIINCALFILMTFTMIHAPWFSTLLGCLAYPTGALLIASGVYQLGESITSTINNRKIKDHVEMIISILNVFCSSAVITMGILTAIGLINSPITVAVMLIFGALMVSVNAYKLIKSVQQLKEINKVDQNDANKIFNFLQNKLFVNEEERKTLQQKIDKMKEQEILTWIRKNYKNFETKQTEIFKQIENDLLQAEENKKDKRLRDIKRIILNEEIKNIIESKIERFGSIVTKKTLLETLETIKAEEANAQEIQSQEEKLKKLFIKIKQETKTKTIAEIIKFGVINIPLMIIPLLQASNLIGLTLYDILMAAGLFSNIGVNITPRYRNIPPAMIKKVLDINSAIDTQTYREYKEKIKNSQKNPNDSTTNKTKDVAFEKIAA